MTIKLRPIRQEEAEACGRIIYEAFRGIQASHDFHLDFPTPESAIGLARTFISHPRIYGVAAEQGGKMVGSNFLDERDAIRGVGPITVDPEAQERGIGRRLMQAVLDRGKGAAGIRLLQEAYNTRSMSLYTSLGFDIREPIVLMRGKLARRPAKSVEIRPLEESDLAECAELCRKVHGFDRVNELQDSRKMFSPLVARRNGRVTAYASGVAFFGHGVAETEEDMRELLLAAGALSAEPVGFLLPVRQASLFRWCLAEGFRVEKPLTLMSIGDYREPQGAWFPSISY